MTRKRLAGLALALGLLALPARADSVAAADTGAGHITGIGGIFLKSKDPKALAAWYRDMLGLHVEDWGGAMLRTDAPGHPSVAVWNAVPQGSSYLAPSTREFMIDFAVDDIDAIVAKLQAKGVAILKRDDSDPTGRFAWIMDPDGTKIELWQAKQR
ncbi:MAG TPA: VOC family protein [Rhizomicrobium sp.]|jgi:predicted enzyme related to lactoylglutathione lyase|nr:VOC family protein [Rhizomicrobium sp.]